MYRLDVFMTVEIFTEYKECFKEWNKQIHDYEEMIEDVTSTYGFRLDVIFVLEIFIGKERG